MGHPEYEAATLSAVILLVPLFVALASYGVQRGWKRPTSVAFVLLCLAVAILSLLSGVSDQEVTNQSHTVPAVIRLSLVNMMAAAAFLSVPSAIFGGMRRATLLVRSIAACLGGVAGLALAVAVGFTLACMADLGCL